MRCLRAETFAPLLTAAALALGAATLAGCGATLNNEIQSGLAPEEQKAGAGVASDTAIQPGSTPAPAKIARVADTYTAAGTPGNAAYKIGPQDVLDISVFKVAELTRSVQVADVGTVNLPLVGEVQAAGRTARELEHDLAKKLGAKYLQSPQVTVYVKEYNSRRVTIDGAVRKPGVYPIRAKTTLVQFIAMAEGPTEASDTSSIVVFRQANGKRSAAKFDLSEIRAGNSEDPVIEEGDVIVVNESATKAAFQNVLKALPITSLFVPLL
jgi:polysaccharide export outer membrane protein